MLLAVCAQLVITLSTQFCSDCPAQTEPDIRKTSKYAGRLFYDSPVLAAASGREQSYAYSRNAFISKAIEMGYLFAQKPRGRETMQIYRFTRMFIFLICFGWLNQAAAQSSAYFPLQTMDTELSRVTNTLTESSNIRDLLAASGVDEEFSKRWARKATEAANAGDTLAKYLFAGRGIYSLVLSSAPNNPQFHPAATDEQLLLEAVSSGFPLAASALLIQKAGKMPYLYFDPAACEATQEAKVLKDAALNGAYVASVVYQHILNYGRSFANSGGDKNCAEKILQESFSLMWASNTTKGVFIDQLSPFRDKLRSRAKSENWLDIERTKINVALPNTLKEQLMLSGLPTQLRLIQPKLMEAQSMREKMEENMKRILADDPRMIIFYKTD